MKKLSMPIWILTGLSVSVLLAAEDLREWPGVRADAERGVVEIDALATGIAAGDLVEFVLINDASGHDYEALATTKAKASDIKAALEFIGCRPGHPVDESRLQFWPRGTRLRVEVERKPDSETEERIRMQKLLLDTRASEREAMDSLVFVGSQYLPDPEDPDVDILAADAYEPRSIISTYNEPTTLMDFPWQAAQGAVYGIIVSNSEILLEEDEQIDFILRPAGAAAEPEVDLRLEFIAAPGGEVERVLLRDENGSLLNSEAETMLGVLSRFQSLRADGKEPYVQLHFDGLLEIGELRELAGMIAAIDTRSGIRVEPPAAGALYYKAFLPDPVMADRDRRGSQPAELCLSRQPDGISAVLKKAEREWDEHEQGAGRIEVEQWGIDSPQDLLPKLREVADDMPILIVYVDDSLALARLMEYLRPVLEDCPTVFVLPCEWLADGGEGSDPVAAEGADSKGER